MYMYIYIYIHTHTYRRQSNAPILLITTMYLWRYAAYGQSVASVFMMTSLCMYGVPGFAVVEHSVSHEPISVFN